MSAEWIGGLEHKPSKDVYFMSLCYLISQRSIDTNTACGAILVAADGRILSTGYNGPPKGSIDENFPMTRPEKYVGMLHSEENAILAYFGSQQDLVGSTMYITGDPCNRCLRGMLQKGIRRFVYAGGVQAKMTADDSDLIRDRNMLIAGQDVQMIEFDEMDKVKALLGRTVDYIDYRQSGKNKVE